MLLEGFERRRVATPQATIAVRVAGPGDPRGAAGPPVLLLHGYPQTSIMWHLVAPRLAEDRVVVAADLRGYGDSDRPPPDPHHHAYSKRATARDQVAVMRALGHERFAVVGHDRGGRVAHRMALDHPDAVDRVAVLDIAPTAHMYATADDAFARAYFHWFLLIQPPPLPERLLGADPAYWVRSRLSGWRHAGGRPFDEDAVAEYVRAFSDPAVIAATCEDYRAAATVDLEHDRDDAGRRVTCPLLVLWGARGFVGRHYDVLATWRERAEDVAGHAVPGGHFIAEESPEEVTAALRAFLAG